MKRPRSSTFSLEGRLDGLPLRVSFSPAHPLADIFHPPHPPIASKSISWDVPLALTRAFRFTLPPFRGVAKAALYCAHPPNPLFPFKGSLVDPQMRASNEFTDDPSKLARYLFKGWGLIDLPLRASNEGLLRPRVARAQKIIRLHPLSPLAVLSSNPYTDIVAIQPGLNSPARSSIS